ncbi:MULTISPECIES: dipeptidase PepV [Exiguobacterium]|uniref:Dipeptidase PepV n=1 Tax=Exiguobacterium acetylicum TaxID=41170 RepID=A0ABX8G8F6_EXIAC|nr:MULTISPECIES: dipeptidase PepV [Exiguobacterium]AOT01443.1 dipeptidase PepV [Exiguobacterium sp. U13-1]QWB29400.1 dipeptidase PepV [Exiguobacterium acetylicum]HBQ77610.1 dipeptidase PepV [Exiguobacterium sp.]
MVNWKEEVLARREDLLEDLKELLRIPSVLDESTIEEGAPFGHEVKRALDWMLATGERDGFTSKNVDGYAGHLEYGQGEELLGILCHLDVVPAGGDHWTYGPFNPTLVDGKLYARGAIDDKGPTMAAYYALKIVKELGLPLSKRIRLIAGGDEESEWRCVNHYFKHEEMPTLGFAPDADFPIINAEKGLYDGLLIQGKPAQASDTGYHLVRFEGGERPNMVPGHAQALLRVVEVGTLETDFHSYLEEQGLTGTVKQETEGLVLDVNGVAAHAMEPDNGKNAALHLARFLNTLHLDYNGRRYIQLVTHMFRDSRGVAIGVAASDETGDLTINGGVFRYAEEQGTASINIRYPYTADFTERLQIIKEAAAGYGFELQTRTHMTPHHVDPNHELIKTLSAVYERHTNQSADLIAIGGGTYARSLTAGVAFGPVFPGGPEVAHQVDEYVDFDELLLAVAIYAEAIYELAK